MLSVSVGDLRGGGKADLEESGTDGVWALLRKERLAALMEERRSGGREEPLCRLVLDTGSGGETECEEGQDGFEVDSSEGKGSGWNVTEVERAEASAESDWRRREVRSCDCGSG